jgi:hypothetical protein
MSARLPIWLATAIPAAALASIAAGRLGGVPADGVALAALLFLALSAWAASVAAVTRARAGESSALLPAAGGSAAAAVICGLVAGALRWPAATDGGWLFASISALAATATVQAVRVSSGDLRPALSAISFPAGVVVFGPAATGVAWPTVSGGPAARRLPAGTRGAAWAALLLLWHPVLARLLSGRQPHLASLRRLHGAEHLAVLTATRGKPLDPERLRGGNPITAHCGGTLAALALPAGIATTALLPAGLVGLLGLLWALSWATTVRTAALLVPRLRWLLAPGLWLQRLTTAAPSERELAVAIAAVRCALEPDETERQGGAVRP